jgi:hypothetical protein
MNFPSADYFSLNESVRLSDGSFGKIVGYPKDREHESSQKKVKWLVGSITPGGQLIVTEIGQGRLTKIV